jgi:lipoyl-dependent peroxiredoxin subunit C
MIKLGTQFPVEKFLAQKAVYKEAIFDNAAHLFEKNPELINVTPGKEKWIVAFSYPKDFTFVCPTEIVGFANLSQDFRDRDTEVFGFSTDSEFVHAAWLEHKADLKDLKIALVSDVSRELGEELGILTDDEKVSQRATFIIDPQGVVRFIYVTDGSVGRNPQEVLRVLDALQTDELCPCNWTPGKETIHV